MKLTLSHDATFTTGSSTLSDDSKQTLDNIAAMLKSNDKASLNIVGHTDDSGAAAFNQSLSERRAMAVADYLIGKGVAAERIINIPISIRRSFHNIHIPVFNSYAGTYGTINTTKGMGESAPAFANDSDESRAKNRRVEIEISNPDQA